MIKTYIITKKFKPNIMISSSAEFAPIARLLKIPFLNIYEDDLTLFPFYSNLFGPFVNYMVCPKSCNTGKWHKKTIYYNGNQELTYLHPKYFTPDFVKVKKHIDITRKNFLIRFSKLEAWHDEGKTGITDIIAKDIIKKLIPFGKVFISTERKLDNELELYKLSINPNEMHDFLYYCDLYIGDSQTMCAEAAVLGTPSIRFNDFVGKLGYLNELENDYGLTFGIKTDELEKLYLKIDELLNIQNLKDIWRKKSDKLINEKIDVTEFISWFIVNYPQSINEYFNNPKIEENFMYHLKLN